MQRSKKVTKHLGCLPDTYARPQQQLHLERACEGAQSSFRTILAILNSGTWYEYSPCGSPTKVWRCHHATLQHLLSFCGTLVCRANPWFGWGIWREAGRGAWLPVSSLHSKLETQRATHVQHPSSPPSPPNDLKEFASSCIPNRWVRGLASKLKIQRISLTNRITISHESGASNLSPLKLHSKNGKKWLDRIWILFLENHDKFIYINLRNKLPFLPRSFLLATATSHFACHAPGRAPHLHKLKNFEMPWFLPSKISTTSKEGHECCRHLLLPFAMDSGTWRHIYINLYPKASLFIPIPNHPLHQNECRNSAGIILNLSHFRDDHQPIGLSSATSQLRTPLLIVSHQGQLGPKLLCLTSRTTDIQWHRLKHFQRNAKLIKIS